MSWVKLLGATLIPVTAETSEITERNQDLLTVMMSILSDLAGLHQEIHEAVVLLRKQDTLLEQYRPLLQRFSTPLAAGLVGRKAARNGRAEVQ